jgi:RNA-binding protein
MPAPEGDVVMALTPRQASYLRSLAHALDPVVRVGANGLTDAVIEKTDRELEIHELLKVKIDGDRDGVREAAAKLSSGTASDVAQIIGKVVVLYRRRKKRPEIRLPADPQPR